jgi:hypothetical protein
VSVFSLESARLAYPVNPRVWDRLRVLTYLRLRYVRSLYQDDLLALRPLRDSSIIDNYVSAPHVALPRPTITVRT